MVCDVNRDLPAARDVGIKASTNSLFIAIVHSLKKTLDQCRQILFFLTLSGLANNLITQAARSPPDVRIPKKTQFMFVCNDMPKVKILENIFKLFNDFENILLVLFDFENTLFEWKNHF